MTTRAAASATARPTRNESSTIATVTDADVVLGTINPENFLGGRIQLDKKKAVESVQRIASALGLSLMEAASGIARIAEFKMADIIRKTTVEKGFDPRDFVLFAFGGAGPAHAGVFARELGVQKVIVPQKEIAATWCAFGAASADILHVYEQVDIQASPFDAARVNASLEALEKRASEQMDRIAAGPDWFSLERPCGPEIRSDAWLRQRLHRNRRSRRFLACAARERAAHGPRRADGPGVGEGERAADGRRRVAAVLRAHAGRRAAIGEPAREKLTAAAKDASFERSQRATKLLKDLRRSGAGLRHIATVKHEGLAGAVTVWALPVWLVASVGASTQFSTEAPPRISSHAENSLVLLSGSVAVAVTNSPVAILRDQFDLSSAGTTVTSGGFNSCRLILATVEGETCCVRG